VRAQRGFEHGKRTCGIADVIGKPRAIERNRDVIAA
jgi:hypothetical protein